MTPNADSVRVIFDLDENGEAAGTVHPFCSDACRDAYVPEWPTEYGQTFVTDFGFDPACEQCGRIIPAPIESSETS